jgi:phospholipid transport system substrate-binding protein
MFKALLLMLSMLTIPTAFAAEPGETVDAFHAALLANMHAGTKTSCADRMQKLGAAIDKDFDIPYLAQRILRRHWDALTDAQRSQFISVFRELVVATYVTNFSEYDGEAFSTAATQNMNGGFKNVQALLKPTSGDTVHFDYVLHQSPEGWRIVNVIADGVSDLAVRSTQYEQKFQEKGYDGLVAALREQIAKAKEQC